MTRRFSAGNIGHPTNKVPQGRKKGSAVPDGTLVGDVASNPALKGWSIFKAAQGRAGSPLPAGAWGAKDVVGCRVPRRGLRDGRQAETEGYFRVST